MKTLSVKKILALGSICSMFSMSCERSAFSPFITGLPVTNAPSTNLPSIKTSWIKISSPNLADGMSPAVITIMIRAENDTPLVGVGMSLTVSGDNNIIVPCSISDNNGLSTCKVYSTKAEKKIITAWGAITLAGDTIFEAVKPMKNAFGIVSSGSIDVTASGPIIISSSGVTESPTALRDSNGVVRVRTSVVEALIEN